MRPHVLGPAAATLLLLAIESVTSADTTRLRAAPSLTLRVGVDTNLYLDAHVPGDFAPVADVILDVAPRLWAAVERGPVRLIAVYDLLDRNALNLGSVILDQLASLRLELRPGPLRLALAAHGERYDLRCGLADTGCQPEDAFQRLGGELSGLFSHRGERVATDVGASYRYDVRQYPDRTPPQLDQEHRAGAWFDLLHPSQVIGGELRAFYLHVTSPNPSANLDRVRGALALWVRPHRQVLAAASYALAWQLLPAASDGAGGTATRRDWIHEGGLELAITPWRTLELFVRGDALVSSSDLITGRYQRVQVLTGVSGVLDLATLVPRRPPLAPSLGRAGAADQPRAVTFSARAPGAARVAVVGDWNGWDPGGCALAPVAGRAGLFRGSCPVPRGEHRYALSVDDRVVAPPDATRYVADGFGGTSGVLVVP